MYPIWNVIEKYILTLQRTFFLQSGTTKYYLVDRFELLATT